MITALVGSFKFGTIVANVAAYSGHSALKDFASLSPLES